MNEKKIIGLTGKYCAGKNLAALALSNRAIPVLDVDKLGHEVIEKEKEALARRFGGDILDKSGIVDRKKLGAKVFGNKKELRALEDIIHPGVNRETLVWIEAQKEKACAINAALLHRSSAFEILDALIIVEAPFFVRLLRAKKRDRLSWAELIKRMRSQSNFDPQYFKGKTDIYRVSNLWDNTNSGRKDRLERRIGEILSLLGIA